MKTAAKAALCSAAFILAVVLLSAAVMHLYVNSDDLYFLDKSIRDENAGSYDTLICGSSHGLCAFDPEVIDPLLGTKTYNLCGALMTVNGMNKMLQTELPRNPVDTVYVEVCLTTLSRDSFTDENGEGEYYVLSRIGGAGERLSYLFKWVKPKDYAMVYSDLMCSGIKIFISRLTGASSAEGSPTGTGYRPKYEITDMRIPEEEIDAKLGAYGRPEEIIDYNLEQLDEIAALCEECGAKPVFIVTPISEASVWFTRNLDTIMPTYREYCEAHGYEYYDFNLLKNRAELLSDEDCFYDNVHLSSKGAEIFSQAFAELMLQARNGEELSTLFYDNYAEYREANPYTHYYGTLSATDIPSEVETEADELPLAA